MNKIIICALIILNITIVAQAGDYTKKENSTFKNPILPGYHPDPSICRVDDDYYLVNSTFEWFPGMPVYHSKDLVNWKLIGYGLHRREQLNLQEGLGDYMGIFAVTLRHHDGLFYLITTCVTCEKGGNFYITAENPAGPWSDPVWLDAPGIDPSLMWDDNGKCYYVGHGNLKEKQEWPQQQGVWLQELDLEQKKLVGQRVQLTHGHANNAVWSEGPHLYKINGKYLLMIAEGGTEVNHAVTVHHSDSLWGPYISDQINPVLTHRHLGQDYPIYAVGHADLVQTQKGDWWSVMLGKRKANGYTLLARETFLCPVSFEGQTPIFNPGVGKLLAEQKRPDLPWTPFPTNPVRDNFEGEKLDLAWNMLRSPQSDWYSMEGGKLTMQLRPNVLSGFSNPSLLARRIEHYKFAASFKLDFNPKNPNEKAGMIIYRNSTCHYQFLMEENAIVVIKTLKGEESEVARVSYKGKSVVLKAEADNLDLQFSYGESVQEMKPIGAIQNMNVISFEMAGGFNGPYVGMYATSSGETSKTKAEFDWFEYKVD
jgi:alpha-N-arabinofuranosidase